MEIVGGRHDNRHCSTYKNYSYGDFTMSTLFVNNLNTASGSTITVPTGKKLVVTDTGGLVLKGHSGSTCKW